MKCEVVVQDAENAMIQSKPTKQVHVESITHGKGSAGEIFLRCIREYAYVCISGRLGRHRCSLIAAVWHASSGDLEELSSVSGVSEDLFKSR